MNHIEQCILELGGVARASELHARGHPAWELRMLSEYGRIVRVRKGWYAAPDTAPQLLRAWRIGGRLACISALVHHGLVDANETAVHVAITTGSSRLRHPDDRRQRLSPGREDSIVLHWAPRVISAGEAAGDERMSRLVVPLEIALEQAEVCRPRTTPAWTLRRDTL